MPKTKRKPNTKPMVETLTIHTHGWICSDCDAITLEKRNVRPSECAMCDSTDFSDRVIVVRK